MRPLAMLRVCVESRSAADVYVDTGAEGMVDWWSAVVHECG